MNNHTSLLITFSSLVLPLFSYSCPLDLFTCQGNNSNTKTTNCSQHYIKCVDSILWVQFHGKGNWYETKNISYPEKTFKILDPQLASKLKTKKDCEFLYIFNNSLIHGFYPAQVYDLLNKSTMFNCSTKSYDFSRDVFEKNYGLSHCGSFELYYSHQTGMLKGTKSNSCDGKPVIEWGLELGESKSSLVDLSLLSVAFTHSCATEPKCFGCVMREGNCSAVGAAGHSGCSCSLQCAIGGNKVKRKVLIACSASASGFVIVTIVLVYLYLRRRKGKNLSASRKSLVRSLSAESSAFNNDLDFLGCFHTPIFTYEELQEATCGFDPSKEIGDGGFGVVYKGTLKDGRIVAVKRLHERNYKRVQQFRNEVEILNRIRHPNLVTLYGCTTRNSRELLLVYEFICNGTLADHIHGPRAPDRLLAWPIRLSIATETATALAYLHSTNPQIIHRDVKTSNILLDDDFHVKVADFGLSRLFPVGLATHVSTAPQGTPGYVDPEYHQCYQLTDKSDVYSFGVVLIELISSMPAVDIDRPRNEINLSSIAMAKIPRGLVHELVDPNLGFEMDPHVRRTVEAVAELAFQCLQSDKDFRPSMDEVRDALAQMDGGDRRTSPGVVHDQMRDDASLLKSSEVTLSPNTVIGSWVSINTTASS